MGTVAAPIPMHMYSKGKIFLAFSMMRKTRRWNTLFFSPKYIGKMTFTVFSNFWISDIRQNGFLSSDINLSDQNGSFDTNIAILCAIFVI